MRVGNMRKKISMIMIFIMMISIISVWACAPTEVQAASKATKNKAAHKVYKKKLKKLKEELGVSMIQYRFIDISGDGVDEMFVSWWPSIYTYKKGKAKRVLNGLVGRQDVSKIYKKKKLVVVALSDAMGAVGYEYYKWKKGKLVRVASKYTPTSTGREFGNESNYWIKGKGKVSKKKVNAYIKKLKGKAKATTIKYKTF